MWIAFRSEAGNARPDASRVGTLPIWGFGRIWAGRGRPLPARISKKRFRKLLALPEGASFHKARGALLVNALSSIALASRFSQERFEEIHVQFQPQVGGEPEALVDRKLRAAAGSVNEGEGQPFAFDQLQRGKKIAVSR